MKAISSQAATKPQTRYKFNAGTELEDNFDVDYYETPLRNYDPQIGRFTGIDALSEQTLSLSSYQFGNNNPVSFNDPTGASAASLQRDGYDGRGGLIADPGLAQLGSDWSNSLTNGFTCAFGEDGGNSGYGSEGSSGVTAGGDFYFTGAAAQQVSRALLNARNHPDDDGNWAFEVTLHNGKVGFWESDYDNYSSNGDKGDVDVATHFVTWDDCFGPGPKSNTNTGSSTVSKMFSLLSFGTKSLLLPFYVLRPDNISLDFTVQNGIPGGNGASITYAVNYLTSGADKGLHLTTTLIPNASGLGAGIGFLSIGFNYYNYASGGQPTLLSLLGNAGILAAGSATPWGDYGLSYNYSGTSLTGPHTWNGISGGIGLIQGAIYGQGTTYKGWK